MRREEVLGTTRHFMMLDVDRSGNVLLQRSRPAHPGYMLQILDENHPGWREIKGIEDEVQEIITKATKQHDWT